MLFKGFLPNVNHIQKVNENDNQETSNNIVFYNESFDGGIFRKKAEPTLNKLSVYNLLRGLEINTDSKVYSRLAELMPTCAVVFDEKKAEQTTSDNIISLQILEVAKLLATVKSLNPSSEEFEAIISSAKKGGLDFKELKEVFKEIEKFEQASGSKETGPMDFITVFLKKLVEKIQSNNSPLETKVYDVIDSKNLEEVEYEDLATSVTSQKNWIVDGIDLDAMLTGEDVVNRISAFFEILIPYLNIKGFSYIQYKGNVYDYLKNGLDLINSISDIRIPEKTMTAYSALITEVGSKIIAPEIELLGSKYSNKIYSPTVQSLFISLMTLYTLKVISSSITSVEKKEEIAKKEEETKKAEMAKEVTAKQVNSSVKAIEDLNQSGFFESKKIFHTAPKKGYTPAEKKMIPQIKEFVTTLGLVKDVDENWKKEEKFDNILSDAVKNFQGSIQIDKKALAVDGKIGPNTRNAMMAYLEALKMKTGVVASTDVKKK